MASRKHKLLLTIPILAIFAIVPSLTFAQAVLNSPHYSIDGIDFASNNVITTNEDGIPPAISNEGPTVVSLNPTNVTITWITDKESTSVINYGTSQKYGEINANPDLVKIHSITLKGLDPETDYNYRVSSKDAFGEVGESTNKTFTTPAEEGINSIKITDIDYTKALVSWTTGNFTTSTLKYGTGFNYGKEIASSSKSYTTSHTVQLTGLTPGQTYHLQIVAMGNDKVSSKSSDFAFTTIDEPKFVSITTKPIDPNTVKINWTTNTVTSGTIDYIKEDEDKGDTAGETDQLINHSTTLSHLYGNTKYSFKITANDNQGKRVVSDKILFTTPIDSTPPVIDSLKVDVARSGSDLVLTASWKTNEPATSGADITDKTSHKVTDIPPITQTSLSHTLTKVGINPATAYTFTASSNDSSGNQAQQSINFISPALQKSIISLIVDSIMVPFGWMSKVFK